MAESENVVQQVFLQLWTRKDELLQSETDLKPYLYVSVRNRCMNALRSTKWEDELDEAILDHQDIQAELEGKELKEKIVYLINCLPDRCRHIYILSREEGLTYNQIAKQLDISVKTVENQMSKALKYLKSRIYSD